MIEWDARGWMWESVVCMDEDRREVTQGEITYRVYAYLRSRHIRINVRRLDVFHTQVFEGPLELSGKIPYTKRRQIRNTVEAWVEARLPSLLPEMVQLARLLDTGVS